MYDREGNVNNKWSQMDDIILDITLNINIIC